MQAKQTHAFYRRRASVGFLLEGLEQRSLLSTSWGAFPQLIHQNAAASDYPSITGAGETVAILDTGIHYQNPSLSSGNGPWGKVIAWKDFIGNSSTPVDGVGHGTGVSGVVAGSGFVSPYDGKYYQGIAPGVNLVMLRTDTESNSTPWPTQAGRISAALDWVIANRTTYNIVAVNMSTGQGLLTDTSLTGDQYLAIDQGLSAQFATLTAAGVFLGASSGNDGATSLGTVEYPAADVNVYSTGSVNSSGSVSGFSSRGPLMDLLAGGENVTTPYYFPSGANAGTNYVNYATGTSFASPAMVATAALIKQINSDFTPQQIMDIMTSTGTNTYDPGTNTTYKLLNVDAALRAAYQQTASPVGANAGVVKLVYQNDGTLDMAWYDTAARDLNFAQRDTNGNWGSVQTVDSGQLSGTYLSMAVDSTGLPGIGYYDGWNGHLKYAQYNGGGNWSTSTVDSARNTGQYVSLTYDQNDNPVMAYYAANTGDLRVAALNQSNVWTFATVDSAGDVGRYPSIAYDRSTAVWEIGYVDTTHGWMKGATLRKGAWLPGSADTSTAGAGAAYVSLAFTTNNHLAVMSYYDNNLARVRYAYSTGRHWYPQLVPSGGKQGRFTNLSFTSAGNADVVYWNQTSNTVIDAQYDGITWRFNNVATGAGNGLFATRNPSGGITAGWLGSGGVVLQDI